MTNVQQLITKIQSFLDHSNPDTDAALVLLEQLQGEMEGKVAVGFEDLCKALNNDRQDIMNTLAWALDSSEDFKRIEHSGEIK